MLKKTILFLLFLNSILLFSQNNKNNVDWENPTNFIKYNINKVSEYSIKISKKGKIKKDSTLFSQYIYDPNNSSITGKNRFYVNQTHGISHTQFYKFKNKYSNDTLPKIKTKYLIKGTYSDSGNIIEEYVYNSYNKLLMKKTYKENIDYSLSKNDTLSYLKTISDIKNFEYEYNINNKIIKEFITRDSTEYYLKFDQRKDYKKTKSCVYCEPKILSQEWKYENDNIVEFINYTYKNEIHSKKKYYYDDNLKLKTVIDSTGFYTINPTLSSITNYINNSDGKIEIQNKFDYFNKVTKKYDSKDKIVFENYEAKFPEYNQNVIYEYLDNKTLIIGTSKKLFSRTEYFFYKNGLLKEIKNFANGVLFDLKKYYYE